MTKRIDSTRKGTRRHVADADVVPPVATLRVSAAWGLPGLLAEHGIPFVSALEDAGLERSLFEHRDNVFTYPQLEKLFAACGQRMQCDHVGLLVGQRSRLADMGLAGEVASCGATVGDGIRAFMDNFNLHDTAATCTLIEAGRHARFVYTVLEHGMRDTRQFQFGGITIAFNIFQDLCGPDFLPNEVTFASRMPANARVFQKYFHAPVHFDTDESSLVFARHWLDKPLPPVEPERRAEIEAAVRRHHESMLADFPAIVRRIARKQLLLGNFTMDDVAAILSMHRRTLDRHLQERGVQYGELVEAVKEDVARQLLRDTAMPIQQIAATVRFSSAANFATAFRRRVGITPSAYRRA
ncbi:MAG TPA: AraC family transcriptional regulator ligand-binding domain-containing protein [Steroidobacteraceae bacterium]|nr:AraC family transcriptional regulator ligand-binding domain-containing protein [Steroidobacteraceae bacterium]